MKIVSLTSGLGNQIYQYIFSRYLEKTAQGKVFLDDSWYWCSMNAQIHQGYELERAFGIKPKCLSGQFYRKDWKLIVELTTVKRKIPMISLLKQLGILGLDTVLLIEEYPPFIADMNSYETPYTGNVSTMKPFSFSHNVGKTGRLDVYYKGVFLNVHWFQYIRDTMIQELTFVPVEDDYNKNMMEQIRNVHSVALHVRRGDYVELGLQLGFEHYLKPVEVMKDYVCDPTFFIFSDDIAFCEKHIDEMGLCKGKDKIVFVNGNTGVNSFRDMQLMSLCKNMIPANSTFSWIAAMLNQNPNKYIHEPQSFGIDMI
ncbi:alpha-1,2-fucosyltransferase [Lachnospiraceae bacterium ZAX-1]